MRGHAVIWAFSLYILALHICLGECQITFSRSWVRGGKLPGQTSFDGGDYDQGGDSLGFVRASKALMEVPHNNNNNLGYNNYPRDSKSLYNLRSNFLRGLFHKWKYSNFPNAEFNGNPSSAGDD